MKAQNPVIILDKYGESLQVKIRVSAKSKRIAVRISKIHGAELVLPKHANKNDAIDFLRSKEGWVRERIRACFANIMVNEDEIPILGVMHKINSSLSNPREVKHDEGFLFINAKNKEVELIKITSYLKWLFAKEVDSLLKEKSKQIGVVHKGFKVKDLTSRWGSCGREGDLVFSWRLIFAPKEILEYVVVHELCHILEFNHSQKFWSLVYKNCEHYLRSKRWLKENGSQLHLYLK